jgi:hypothetical protein
MTKNKQQTAMQELIQRLKALYKNHFGEVGLEISIEIASQLLEKEKHQLMDARRNGSYKATEKYGETRTNIQYYNETYGEL